MTNPNDAVGTNAAYGGRTSANAFNDDLAAYTRGILSGWECSPNAGLTVSLGGDGSTRDVAVAEDNAGNKISINNISGSPIDVTLNAAPGANSRIDLVVAYVDNPPQGVSTVADNPSACGIIKVTGTASSTPVAPNDSAIRTAITGDGASGATAYYVILAYITISSGTTDITTSNIQAGPMAKLSSNNIDLTTLPLDYSTTEQDTLRKWINGKKIYKKTLDWGYMPNNDRTIKTNQYPIGGQVVGIEAVAILTDGLTPGPMHQMPYVSADGKYDTVWATAPESGTITVATTADRSGWKAYITLYYTKP